MNKNLPIQEASNRSYYVDKKVVFHDLLNVEKIYNFSFNYEPIRDEEDLFARTVLLEKLTDYSEDNTNSGLHNGLKVALAFRLDEEDFIGEVIIIGLQNNHEVTNLVVKNEDYV